MMARRVNSDICMVGGTKGWNFFGGAWLLTVVLMSPRFRFQRSKEDRAK